MTRSLGTDVSAGLRSTTVTVRRPDLGPPALVSPLDGDFTNDNTPLFVWDAVTGDDLDTYLLQVTSGDTDSGPYVINKVIPRTTTSDEPTAPLADDTYQWRVIARDIFLNTASSVTLTFTIDTVPPSVGPEPVSPEDGALFNTRTVDFEWKPSVGADIFNYRLQITSGDIDAGAFDVDKEILHPTTGDQITLPGNGTYEWRVGSKDLAGNETGTADLDVRTFTVDTILTVTKTGDTNDGVCDADCSLREAIVVATSGDNIVVPAGTYTLTRGSELTINTSLTLTGNGANVTIIQAATSSADATHRVFFITGDNSTVTISSVTIRHGKAIEIGGILNASTLTLTNSTVIGNTADVAGGIGNFSGSNLTLTNSTVRNNSAGIGGGIVNAGTMTLTNSTVSGNSAATQGGGILDIGFGTLTLTNSTVSNNTASSGGGIFLWLFGKVELTNTLVAGNIASASPDCGGLSSLTSLGHNLIGTSDGCSFTPATGDLVNVDPKLGPLQDNGGPTMTHALLFGSPAIDAGGDASCPATDQRGVSRPQGIACDIGAFEFVPGDGNGDFVVDVADLRFIIENWGLPTDARADLNGDGLVDIWDLVLVGINAGRGGS